MGSTEQKADSGITTSAKDIATIAYVLEEAKGEFILQDIILDEVRSNEYLIEMKYSGICHTDIVVQQGAFPQCQLPAILGHEGAGYVRAIGSNVQDKDIAIGDFVLLTFNVCGDCKQCRRGYPAYCQEGGKLHIGAIGREDGSSPARLKDGRSVRGQFFGHSSFAKMSVVNETCVVKYPHNPAGAAIFAACGCGFQTGAGTVLNVLKPQPEDSIAIFGMGSVGLTALMAAKYLGIKQIIAVDVVDERLQLAKDLGATDAVNSKQTTDFVAEIQRIAGGGVDFCVDCAGNVGVIEGMIECLARTGTAASVGIPPAGRKVSVDPLKLLLMSKRWIGVIEGESVPQKFIPELVEMQKSGRFPLEKLCKTYSYTELKEAIEDMNAGKVIKPVIMW